MSSPYANTATRKRAKKMINGWLFLFVIQFFVIDDDIGGTLK
jgi:hypothetical protein